MSTPLVINLPLAEAHYEIVGKTREGTEVVLRSTSIVELINEAMRLSAHVTFPTLAIVRQTL